MADYAFQRITGYVLTIVLHLSNVVYMGSGLDKTTDDPELKIFAGLQSRYFTCWNFGLQIIYSFLGLLCETLEIYNSRNKSYKLNKHLKAFRDILFAAILWPSTMLVFTLFWSLYLYDRELIFPVYIDRVLTPLSNHIIHTLIVPIAVWEVVYRPREQPKSHTRNIFHLVVHMSVYLLVLAYTYNELGIWIYPILTRFYGTIYFPITLLIVVLLSFLCYYSQWVITDRLWGGLAKAKQFKKL